MPSRISQILSGQQQPIQQPQQPLNNSIAQTRQLMQMIQSSKNQQAMLAQMLENNPNSAYISQMLRSGNSLEGIARALAQQRGVDINDVIRQLSVGQ